MADVPLARWTEPPQVDRWVVNGYDIWKAGEGVYNISRMGVFLRSFQTLLMAHAWAEMNEPLP